jgi:hypothetical protein
MKFISRHVVNYLVAPVVFLTVALTAGIRFQIGTNTFRFVYPPLVSCIVGALAIILLLKSGIPRVAESYGRFDGAKSEEPTGLDRVSRVLLITAVYFATVQVFSMVTPESGLLSFFFNVFYLLILLNDLFVVFNPRRVAGALAVMLGASFLLKYLVLADVFAPAGSWGKYVLQELLKAGSLGGLDQEPFAPATGYLALFTIGLYILGLFLIAARSERGEALLQSILAGGYGLTPSNRLRLANAVARLEQLNLEGEMRPGTALSAATPSDPQQLRLPPRLE